MKKLKSLFSRPIKLHKKSILLISVLCAALLISVLGFVVPKLKVSDAKDKDTNYRTTVLQAQTMTESISVSGTVGCQNVVNVTATGAERVKEIHVKVGQTVHKGDLLFKLDTTEIDKELEKLGSSGTRAIKDAQEILDSAVNAQKAAAESVKRAESRRAETAAQAQKAFAPYQSALNSCAPAKSAYVAALARKEQAGAALNLALAADEQAKAQLETARTAFDAAAPDDAGKESLRIELSAKESAQASTGETLRQAQAQYAEAETALSQAETAYQAAKANSNLDALENAWNAASAADTAALEALEAAKNAQTQSDESVKSARRSLEAAKSSTEYSELLKRKEQCTIKAESDGTVTEINATIGSSQGTAPLAVIQDLDHLVVSVNIKEFDISRVSIGQEVLIRSDATGSREVRGKVSQIAMTAKNAESGSGVSFPAVISLQAKESGLRVGMNVKAQIVLSQKKGVFMVPQDAVGEENGVSVVYLKEENGWKAVPVTTGQTDDYFIEISGNALKEGQEIRSSADLQEAIQMSGAV